MSIKINHYYKTPVGVFNEINIEEELSTRMVLTGKCNLSCEFCIYKTENYFSAEVKSKDLIDMVPSEELKLLLKELKNKTNYNTIHLTGGEPTVCESIVAIAEMIRSLGLRIHMVSNLLNIKTIEKLSERRLLDEVTFSYIPKDIKPDIRNESSDNYKTVDLERNETIKNNVLRLMEKNPHLILKTNIVCSRIMDIEDCILFINWCWDNGVRPRLQRDRSLDRIEGSTYAVKKILSELGMKEQRITLRIPGATEICEYKNHEDKEIKVKIFNQNFRFDSVCKKCNLKYTCDKALSSIRIFNKKSGPKIALCTKLDEEFAIFDIESFIKSEVISEIDFYKRYPNEYMDKFCLIKNHQ